MRDVYTFPRAKQGKSFMQKQTYLVTQNPACSIESLVLAIKHNLLTSPAAVKHESPK